MKRTSLVILFALITLPVVVQAQRGGGSPAGIGGDSPVGTTDSGAPSRPGSSTTKTDPMAPPTAVGKQTPGVSMPLYRSAAMEPAPGVPFSASVVTEWKRFFPDGNTETLKSRQLLARDSSGRIFEEWRTLTFNGDKKPTSLIGGEYIDPVKKTHFRCTAVPQRQCVSIPYTSAAFIPAPIPGAKDLGSKKIEDLDASGRRETIPADKAKNTDKDLTESWFSPKLQLNLTERHATEDILDFSIKDIKLGDPDPALFQLSTTFPIVPGH